MSDARPEPLTSAEMDMRDLDGFMLNVVRLFSSELWALTKERPEAFRGAVALWAKAWKQIPPASLPNDETILAAFSEMALAKFRKLREIVMRGFVECSDGRLYNKTLAEEVNRVWPGVQKTRKDRQADKERLKQWRERKRNGGETTNETEGETRTKPISSVIERDRDRDTESIKETSSLRSESSEAVKPKPRPASKPSDPDGFAEFYAAFPRKEDPAAARKAYAAALKKIDKTTLFEGARRYAEQRAGQDKQFTKQPATWLNKESWANELPLNSESSGEVNGQMQQPGEAREHYLVRRFKERGLWLSIDGAPPDSPDCCMPKGILVEFGYVQTHAEHTA